ncbi:hypothetical protein [Edaphobacter aggregans]|nr:hypothetical protein [Edaphobacter aggregans]
MVVGVGDVEVRGVDGESLRGIEQRGRGGSAVAGESLRASTCNRGDVA